MKENDINVTECLKCGARYENYFKASPCCRALVMKVDEHGSRTTITFLSALSLPDAKLFRILQAEKQK
jgi:hypothetical protein